MSAPTIKEWPKVARKLDDWQLDMNIASFRKFVDESNLSHPNFDFDMKTLSILEREKRRRQKLGTKRRWRIKPMFAWYDLWIGVFIDQPRSRAYVFPIPCFGFRIEW